MKLRGLTGKKYFSSQNLVKPSQYKDSLTNVLADACRQVALMQRFTRFTFSPPWSQNCQLRHLFKVISLTTFPTASGTFENSIKGQLAARELPRTRAFLKDFLRRNRSREELKNKRCRIPFHVESSLVPLGLKFFMIFASRLPSKISRS